MKNRFFLFLKIVTVLFPLLADAEGVSISSENIRNLLESKNAKVGVAKLEAKAAEEREGVLGRSFFPSFEVYGGQESSQSVYGAEAQVNVFNGGRDKIEDEVRSLDSVKRGYQTQRVIAEELEKARNIYWEILYLREKRQLLNTSLSVNAQNLRSAQRRIKSGVATDSDRFEFEMKEVDIKREMAQTEVDLDSQVRALEILLGFAESEKAVFNEPLLHDHQYESVIEHSSKQHEFLFKESEIQGEQYSLAARGNRNVWWPKLNAYAAYTKSYETKDETVVGLRLTLSLAAGLEANREASALSKEAMAARTLSQYKKQEVEAHLEVEMAQLKLLHDQVHEAEQNITRAESYYRITQSEYSRGVKNSPDVLGASEKLFDMRHKRLEIVKNFQVAKSHILSKIGK